MLKYKKIFYFSIFDIKLQHSFECNLVILVLDFPLTTGEAKASCPA